MKLKSDSITIVGMVVVCICISMLVATYAMPVDQEGKQSTAIVPDSAQVWTPTKEDIEYQDSMYQIIRDTEKAVDDISQTVDKIIIKLDRIYYKNGMYDSIAITDSMHLKRYNKHMEELGYKNDEEHMWITAEGDTIYE